MKLVIAIGGNALLRRGQALSPANQLANVRVAAAQLARVALKHDLVLTHGNGPQVGLLALQAAAYTTVQGYPLDVLGAQTDGTTGADRLHISRSVWVTQQGTIGLQKESFDALERHQRDGTESSIHYRLAE